MKLLLLIPFFISSLLAFAQVPENSNSTLFPFDSLKKNNTQAFQKLLHSYFQKKQTQNNLLAYKQGTIAILPQDRMPCIVPDTNGLVQIPNGWKGVNVPYQSLIHPIPNPALPEMQFYRYNVFDKDAGIPTK